MSTDDQLDKATLNHLAKNLKGVLAKTFTSTKIDRGILDKVNNKIVLSKDTISRELDRILQLLNSSDPKLQKLVDSYQSHLFGLDKATILKAKGIVDKSSIEDIEVTGSFKNLRTRTTKYIRSIFGSSIDSESLEALSKVLQLGHESGVYSFKLVDELRILGRVQNSTRSNTELNLSSEVAKIKRIEFLISSVVDNINATDLTSVFGYDLTNSGDLANLIADIFNNKISEQVVFEKLKELKSSIRASSVTEYYDYIQFKGKYQLFSTIEKNATKLNTRISISIENSIDNVLKGSVIQLLSKAGNNLTLGTVKKYLSSEDYTKFRTLFAKNLFADKEVVTTLTKLVTSKTFEELTIDRVVNTLLRKPTSNFSQIVNHTTEVEIPAIKVKIPKSKAQNKLSKLSDTLQKTKSIRATSLRTNKGQFQSVSSLEALLRAKLYQTIRKNMTPPALTNRTGRFAKSVELKNITFDQRSNAISAFLTYMKYPYATFEPGGKRGSVDRSPTQLIDRSMREIAKDLTSARMKVVIV